jgi:hypothetical protein
MGRPADQIELAAFMTQSILYPLAAGNPVVNG